MADLAGPQNKKDAKKRKNSETIEIPEDTDRDPKRAEN